MMDEERRYRTIWISDFHLGTKHTKAEFLLDFLRNNDSDYLYLVGDIFDGWALGKSWYWPQLHNDVIQKLLRKVRKGTKVIYIPGNHDEFARGFVDMNFGGISTKMQCIHTMVDGRQFLVLHGDRFDGVIQYARWISFLGSKAYEVALVMNRWYNFFRKKMGLSYWSLSAYLKNKAKRAVQHIADFEKAVVKEARKFEVEGVVCGHIHQPEISEINGIVYCNTGDWVESCTALVEHVDGRLEVLRWSDPEKRPERLHVLSRPEKKELVTSAGQEKKPSFSSKAGVAY